MQVPGQIAERNQGGTGNSADLIFLRLADVEDEDMLASVDPLLQFFHRRVEISRRPSIPGRRMPCRRHAAELFVVDQLTHRWVRAAHGTLRIFAQPQLAEAHAQGVEEQEAPDERVSDPDDELDRLGGLNGPDDAGQHAQHAAFGAAGHEPRWRRLWIQAAIARAFRRAEHRRLTFETEDAAVRVGLAQDDARIVDQIARREVVRAVDDHVVRCQELQRIARRERRLVELDMHLGIERL